MSGEVAQNYALTTKTFVGCDSITVRIKVNALFFEGKYNLRAKIEARVVSAKCSGVVRSTKKMWADVKGWHLYSCWGFNRIFGK
jgi:hypothetical protein